MTPPTPTTSNASPPASTAATTSPAAATSSVVAQRQIAVGLSPAQVVDANGGLAGGQLRPALQGHRGELDELDHTGSSSAAGSPAAARARRRPSCERLAVAADVLVRAAEREQTRFSRCRLASWRRTPARRARAPAASSCASPSTHSVSVPAGRGRPPPARGGGGSAALAGAQQDLVDAERRHPERAPERHEALLRGGSSAAKAKPVSISRCYAEPGLRLVRGEPAVVAAEAALVARERAQPGHPAGRGETRRRRACVQARPDRGERSRARRTWRGRRPRSELADDRPGIVHVQEAVARRARRRAQRCRPSSARARRARRAGRGGRRPGRGRR